MKSIKKNAGPFRFDYFRLLLLVKIPDARDAVSNAIKTGIGGRKADELIKNDHYFTLSSLTRTVKRTS